MSAVNVQSFKVASTLSAYRGVGITAAQTVGYPANNQKLPIGITLDTVRDTTQGIAVAGPGSIAPLEFNDTVSAGALVALNNAGQGVPFTGLGATSTAVTLASAYLGVLVGAAVSATGTIANVFILPGYDRGSV